MAIYVAKIKGAKTPLPIAPNNGLSFNCVNWYSNTNVQYGIPIYQVSPFYLHDDNGYLLENIWQGSKVYLEVNPINKVINGKTIWQHPQETHVVNGELTLEYWQWRDKLWKNPYPVRYPNGYNGRHNCLFAVWCDNGKWEVLNYIPARKKIYCKVYEKLVKQTEAYQQLQALYDAGCTMQLCEIDVEDALITEELLIEKINDPRKPFGHGYVLAACLMRLTNIFDV